MSLLHHSWLPCMTSRIFSTFLPPPHSEGEGQNGVEGGGWKIYGMLCMETMNGAITTYLTADQKLNFTRMKAPKTGVKDDPLTNILGSTVILGVHLVCLGTENHQKHQNPFFFWPELIYVGKSIPEKILEQLLRVVYERFDVSINATIVISIIELANQLPFYV